MPINCHAAVLVTVRGDWSLMRSTSQIRWILEKKKKRHDGEQQAPLDASKETGEKRKSFSLIIPNTSVPWRKVQSRPITFAVRTI